MSISETLTQEATSPPTEVIPEVVTADAATPPEPSAAESEAPAPEETPFAIVGEARYKDVYELLDHPDVKEHLDRENRRSEERYLSQSEQRIAEATRNWEATQLSRSFAGAMGTVLEKLEDGDIAGTERALSRVEQMVKEYEPERVNALKTEGATAAANVFFQNLLERAPDRRSRDDLEDFGIAQFRKVGQDAWGQMLDRLIKTSMEQAENKGHARGLKEGREAAVESEKAEARGQPGAGPDATPARSTGTRTVEEELLDPNTSVQRLIEIRTQQKAGG